MVSIAKLPGAKPKPAMADHYCPRCERASLVVADAKEFGLGGMVDRFVRCVLCTYRGPLGGLRVVSGGRA